VANGPNIFQMLFVLHVYIFYFVLIQLLGCQSLIDACLDKKFYFDCTSVLCICATEVKVVTGSVCVHEASMCHQPLTEQRHCQPSKFSTE